MKRGPQKHSITLKGHRTSVSLESPFWEAFREIARQMGLTTNALALKIDSERTTDSGLASTIRVYVLNHYRDLALGLKRDETPKV
ncbi:MAG: ribbon-helix-helix domain-containing protein [Microgenomates group bacterium]